MHAYSWPHYGSNCVNCISIHSSMAQSQIPAATRRQTSYFRHLSRLRDRWTNSWTSLASAFYWQTLKPRIWLRFCHPKGEFSRYIGPAFDGPLSSVKPNKPLRINSRKTAVRLEMRLHWLIVGFRRFEDSIIEKFLTRLQITFFYSHARTGGVHLNSAAC